MNMILFITLEISLAVHILLIAASIWKVWRGENVIDRLIATDLVTTLALSVLVVMSIIQRDSIYIDVALGLTVVGSLVTVALAKYIADQQRV